MGDMSTLNSCRDDGVVDARDVNQVDLHDAGDVEKIGDVITYVEVTKN